MIFVTVGSQKFQFDRLIKAVDGLVASGVAGSGAFAQTGACSYIPGHMQHEAFLDREAFRSQMDACDVVVTHGGTGAIIGAVKDGKKFIAADLVGAGEGDREILAVGAAARLGPEQVPVDAAIIAILDEMRDKYVR